MKRYIIALIALLSLTACKIADGFSRNEDAVDRLLYNRAVTAIREASNLSYYAIYADILLGGDETEIRLINAVLSKNYLVTIEEDGVKFQRILSNGVLENSYKVTTGGKRLSEGAVWELTTISQYQKLSAQFVGKQGAEREFYIEKIDEKPFFYEYDKLSYHFDFKYDASIDALAVLSTISGVGTIDGEGYTLDFTILKSAPVVTINCSGVDSGVIDIKYKDLVLGTEDKTTAVINGKYVSYE